MKEDVKKIKVDFWDVQELACKILGLDYDLVCEDEQILYDEIYDELEIKLDRFQEIIERLLPLVAVSKSPTSNTLYKGFAHRENRTWLLKTEI